MRGKWNKTQKTAFCLSTVTSSLRRVNSQRKTWKYFIRGWSWCPIDLSPVPTHYYINGLLEISYNQTRQVSEAMPIDNLVSSHAQVMEPFLTPLVIPDCNLGRRQSTAPLLTGLTGLSAYDLVMLDLTLWFGGAPTNVILTECVCICVFTRILRQWIHAFSSEVWPKCALLGLQIESYHKQQVNNYFLF